MANKDTITLEALRPYFKNSKYSDEYQKPHYERTLPKHIEQPDQWVFSWNWSAALFPDLWMFYRKMYWQGLLVFFVSYVSGYLISYLIGTDSFVDGLIPYFFTFFLSGAFGNALYFRDLKHRIENDLPRKGVSVGAVWALLALAIMIATVEISVFGL
ncbi:MAG: DUF2628 domain-containing protein [bacterium]|nr:DUF2628 domain-containing protein [bacterium]